MVNATPPPLYCRESDGFTPTTTTTTTTTNQVE